jgi:NAD(P)-dependent dehydrogenase (short-subunit alcohol dehydrogenase family)
MNMDTRTEFDLSGRVALVTGASRGIGAEIAKLLAKYGATVIVSSRKRESCEQVVDAIRAAGGKAEALALHIGELQQIEAAFANIEKSHGRLDVLVNNAATNPYYGHILDTDLGAFQKTVDVNIRGYFYCCVHGGRLMRAQGRGSIVNVASVNGVTPGPQQGIYSITKSAVIGLTKAFARECGPLGIRVNALLPGLTQTKFAAALVENEAAREHFIGRTPLGRVGQPQELAGAVLYLASDASSYVTGAQFIVDGGYLA